MRYCISRCNQTGLRLGLLLVLIVVTQQALTPSPAEITHGINDKLGHGIVFFVLALLADHAWADSPFDWRKALTLLGYGLFIECAQYFVPERQFSLLDLLADGIGIGLYGLLFLLFLKGKSRT